MCGRRFDALPASRHEQFHVLGWDCAGDSRSKVATTPAARAGPSETRLRGTGRWQPPWTDAPDN